VREGWIARTHFSESCAALWGEGALVHLEDLVLHDAGMDVRAPTYEVIRAHAVLRARRWIAAAASDWPLSEEGLESLRSETSGAAEPRTEKHPPANAGEESDDEDFDAAIGGDPSQGLGAELAAIDAAIVRSRKALDGEIVAPRSRDPLVYDLDWDEKARLRNWRAVVDQTSQLPPLLAAALLWEAWRSIEPLQHRPWLGALLVGASLRARGKTKSHLLCLNTGLRLVARERRRASDREGRLAAWCEAVTASAEAGMKDHDRWLLARQTLERKLVGRRSTSHLAALIDVVLAHPIANAALIARELGVTRRAAQNLVAELGLREATGRGRYRAWGIL
jgi:hypothetical protein